jgi:hypothetical protein
MSQRAAVNYVGGRAYLIVAEHSLQADQTPWYTGPPALVQAKADTSGRWLLRMDPLTMRSACQRR